MHIKDIMSHPVVSCPAGSTLDQAARLMWEFDCGIIPVVGDDGSPTWRRPDGRQVEIAPEGVSVSSATSVGRAKRGRVGLARGRQFETRTDGDAISRAGSRRRDDATSSASRG